MSNTPTLTRTKKPATVKQQQVKNALLDPVSLIRSLGGLSLYEFLQFFWDEITQDEFKPNWHVELFCNELEAMATRVAEKKPKLYDLIVNVPPGTTKTIIFSIMFPAWCWTKWYWMQFITGSYSSALALESAEKSRDIIKSDKFMHIFPELSIKLDKDVKSNYKVVKKIWERPNKVPRTYNGGNRFSTSVGATVTGFHGHVIIIDDPLNPEQAASEVELLTANRWMEGTLSNRKVDKAITPIILIMQRLHEDDCSGHILAKKKKNVKHICLPGEIVNYKEQLNPPELEKFYINGLLDPVRMPVEVLEEMEIDMGQYNYAGQVGQNPTPPSGGMFKVDRIRTMDKSPSLVNIDQIVRYWDKAGTDEKEIKKGKDAAYTVGCKMARLANGKYLIMDIVRGRWGSETREDTLKQTAEFDGTDVHVYIEQEPGSGGKESAESTITNLAGFHCEKDPPVGNKIARADTFSVQVNNGNVAMLRADWNHDFIEELRFFPFSKYKDQTDASSGAFNKLVSKRTARVLGGRK